MVTSVLAKETIARGQVVSLDGGAAEVCDDPSVHPYGVAIRSAKMGELVEIERGGSDAEVFVQVATGETVAAGDLLYVAGAGGKVSVIDPDDTAGLDPGIYFVLGSASNPSTEAGVTRCNIDRFLVYVPTPD